LISAAGDDDDSAHSRHGETCTYEKT